MNLNIEKPEYLSLDDLLEKRLFRIPRYQRAYSWKNKHRSDMFNDIRQLYENSDEDNSDEDNSDEVHFMATVVGLCRKTETIGTTKYQFIEVVDGQQRITTLVLLLKAIELKMQSLLKDSKWCQQNPQTKREQNALANLLVNPDDNTQVLIQTNHDTSQYFANYLTEGEIPPDSEVPKTLADKELLRAIRDCKNYVNSWDDIFMLLRIIKNQLYFVFHKITHEASVYTVFEVLNDRGLTVTPLDKLKSKLMAVVFDNDAGNKNEHIRRLHQIWGDIYETVGLHEGLDTEALQFAATLRGNPVGKTVQPEDAVSQFMHEVVPDPSDSTKTDPAKTIEISKWMLEVTKAIKRVYDVFSPSKDVVINIIQVRMLATAIFLRKLSEKEERDLLNQLEKTSFRIFGLSREFSSHRITAQTERGEYLRLANQITNKSELSVDEVLQGIKNLGNRFGFNSIEASECYEWWSDELRYLLYRYEQDLAASQGKRFTEEEWNSIWKASAMNSIEHIHPQSKASQIEISVHRIGNLLLLPPHINSGLRDKDPEEKIQAYRNTRLLGAEAVANTIEADGWDDNDIAGRSYEIAEWVNETFND